ncbi:hypothetical protein [Luteimonas aquatica]|uniref:hypothetical protein n=1 Tax=Luteimonas aquatica TaxID=450364 RepID=UPI001F566698|nr:hypothetical protein [Luteimonas aquatica]
MRTMFLVAAALGTAFAAGCAPADKTPAGGEPPATDATVAPAEAKIGGDAPSPVPAFKGGGEHFSIDIQSVGKGDHKTELVWGSGSYKASGNLRYNGPVMDAPSTLIVLSGELTLPEGARPATVEIKREECTDDADRKHMHSVQVHVEGVEAEMRGCGDLAQY